MPFRAVGKNFPRCEKNFPRQEIVNGTAGNFFFTAGKKIATAGDFGRCGREPEAPPAAFKKQPKCEVPCESSCSATEMLVGSPFPPSTPTGLATLSGLQ